MADDFDDVVDNVKSSSTWMRIVYMIGFCIVLYVVSIVIWFLTGAQALFSIFTGSDNRNLRQLGASLAEYVNQILRFLTYNSERRPFPFRPFPEGEEADTVTDDETADARTGDAVADNEGPTGEAGGQFDDLAFLSRQDEIAEGGPSEQQDEDSTENGADIETDDSAESDEQSAMPDGELESDENQAEADEGESRAEREESAKDSREENLQEGSQDNTDNDVKNSS